MFDELMPNYAPDGLTLAMIDALIAEVDAENGQDPTATRLGQGIDSGLDDHDLAEQALAPVIALRPRLAPAVDTTEAA